MHFHQLEVVRLEDVLGSAEREVVAPLNGRIQKRKYVQQQGGAQSSYILMSWQLVWSSVEVQYY